MKLVCFGFSGRISSIYIYTRDKPIFVLVILKRFCDCLRAADVARGPNERRRRDAKKIELWPRGHSR